MNLRRRFFPEGGVSTTTLTAVTGSYAINGQSCLFKINQMSSVGNYAVTGNTVNLRHNMLAGAGSYVVTGISVLFRTVLPSSAGSYGLTLINTPLKILQNTTVGSYVITGVSNLFRKILTSNSGSYTMVGYPITDLVGGPVGDDWIFRLRKRIRIK